MSIVINHIFITISCAETSLSGWLTKIPSKRIGERQVVVSMFMGKAFFNTKPSEVTIFRKKQSKMKWQTQKESGLPNRSGEKYLEQSFQRSGDSEARHILEGQLRECYGRVVYSHKTHEKCADILFGRLSMIKNVQILLSALTTGGFISTFLGFGTIGAAIRVVLSTALLILNTYTKNYDL